MFASWGWAAYAIHIPAARLNSYSSALTPTSVSRVRSPALLSNAGLRNAGCRSRRLRVQPHRWQRYSAFAFHSI